MYQFHYQPTPKNILLDLMGVNTRHALSTSQLNLISDAFDISINNLRVTLNRLVSAGLVSNDDRGVYCLTESALNKRRFINRWRSNSLMQQHWDGSWLGCHLPKGTQRTQRNKSLRALSWYGFRAGLDQLWVRPNNINVDLATLLADLRTLGIESAAQCFVLSEIDTTLSDRWTTELWDIEALDSHYAALIETLDASEAGLHEKSVLSCLAETCRLGGEAIHRLATDPLLPEQIRPGKLYESLKHAMLRYDKTGRDIWLQQLAGES